MTGAGTFGGNIGGAPLRLGGTLAAPETGDPNAGDPETGDAAGTPSDGRVDMHDEQPVAGATTGAAADHEKRGANGALKTT